MGKDDNKHWFAKAWGTNTKKGAEKKAADREERMHKKIKEGQKPRDAERSATREVDRKKYD